MANRSVSAEGTAALARGAETVNRASPAHDIIAIGASAGGVEALCSLVDGLPPEFPASIFVVLHVMATGKSVLPAILERAGDMDVSAAVDAEPVERGHIYIAPPDYHMILDGRRIALTRGPRENGHRPAIDPLFRSAARQYGDRVIAVVLSGTLDDGAAGLKVVKNHGGLAVVQEPDDALYADMPLNAIQAVEPDQVAPISEIPDVLATLVELPADTPEPHDDEIPVDPVEETPEAFHQLDGQPSNISCPECGGVLWAKEEGNGLTVYRCQVGHAYSTESLTDEHGKSLEAALWTAARSLEERAELMRRLERRTHQRASIAARYRGKAEEAEDHAAVLRRTIAEMSTPLSEEVES
jgi:two-component system, chemotaxis family, protein-glutamate methylesterase/glutaminase